MKFRSYKRLVVIHEDGWMALRKATAEHPICNGLPDSPLSPAAELFWGRSDWEALPMTFFGALVIRHKNYRKP